MIRFARSNKICLDWFKLGKGDTSRMFSRSARRCDMAHMLRRRLMSSSSSSSSSKESPKVGFVGLGNMGLPMCLNLLSKGDTVVCYDTHHIAAAEAEQQGGAQAASSLAHVGQAGCQVILTMLPGCSAVDAVLSALLDSVVRSTVFVDCSTISPTTSRKWHERVAAQGHIMLDAPVSGGVKGAQDGALTFMVGCDREEALEVARPCLEKMGTRIIPCGGAGTGSATKLCNNLALATQMIGICEAMNLGEGLGVDPIVLADVMNTSTAKCWSSEVNNPHPAVAKRNLEETGVGSPASRDYERGFGTSLMRKDLGLAVAAGQDSGVALPLGSACKELYQMADLRGLGSKDFGMILQFLRGQ